jgi:hypothetical protein
LRPFPWNLKPCSRAVKALLICFEISNVGRSELPDISASRMSSAFKSFSSSQPSKKPASSLSSRSASSLAGAWLRPTTWRLPRSPTECEPGGVHGTASWNSVMAPIADPTKGRFAGKNCKGSTILTLGGSDPLVWLSYERLERMEREAGQDRARGPRSSNRARLLTGSRNRNQTGRSATNGEPCTGRTALGR